MRAPTRNRLIAASALLCTLTACGGNSDDDGPGTGGPLVSPEAAYAAFAAAIRDNDPVAFKKVTNAGYQTDVTVDQDDLDDYLADLHWATEHGVLLLPDDVSDVVTGVERLHWESDDVAELAEEIGVEHLADDDIAVATAPDAYDTALNGTSGSEACDDRQVGIEECVGAPTGETLDIIIGLVRTRDGWQVFGSGPDDF